MGRWVGPGRVVYRVLARTQPEARLRLISVKYIINWFIRPFDWVYEEYTSFWRLVLDLVLDLVLETGPRPPSDWS